MSRGRFIAPSWPTPLFVLALPLAAAANPAVECSESPHPIAESKRALGPRHHPIGRPLPDSPNFNQPDRCRGALRFFDQNHNGEADPGEVRVFGSGREVDCASCHGESPETTSAASSSVVLRQEAARLCLICHRL